MTPIETLRSMPPGMIGVPCGESGRTSDFIVSLMGLWKPAGTVMKKASGLGTAWPLNQIGEVFMADPKLEWLFLTNDDNLCPPDTIPRLWAHDKDFVTGLYFSRHQPFEPVLFDKVMIASGVEPGAPFKAASNRWYRRHLMETGEMGLRPIVACGDGCLLIRRRVFEALSMPFWEYGETVTDACDHDMVFSRKVRDAGFGMYCDTDLWVDHVGLMAIRPHRDEQGNWTARLVQGTGKEIAIPAPKREA